MSSLICKQKFISLEKWIPWGELLIFAIKKKKKDSNSVWVRSTMVEKRNDIKVNEINLSASTFQHPLRSRCWEVNFFSISLSLSKKMVLWRFSSIYMRMTQIFVNSELCTCTCTYIYIHINISIYLYIIYI